jgi:carboxypeptidase Q
LSGSTNLEAALDWIVLELKRDGFDRVVEEDVSVTPWIRGTESLDMEQPRVCRLPMLGLGGSVGTPPEGLRAATLVVTNSMELAARAIEAKGRIVVFNVPFTSYGETVRFRVHGAVEAARVGAVASLVRSVSPDSLRTPHTGMMSYENGVPAIPHAAITSEDAEWLLREQRRGRAVTLRLRMDARTGAPSRSRNIVADVRGREWPEEIVVMGGHIDSWDVGQGAQDDGGGCVAAWEVIRLVKAAGLRPRRTMRLVLWTNEENGLAGARAYAQTHRAELGQHVLAFESDEGIFSPTGFRFTGSDGGIGLLRAFLPWVRPAAAATITPGARAADATQLLSGGVPVLDLTGDPARYFRYHHTEADTVDKIAPQDMRECVAAMLVLLFGVAEHPVRLPR